MDREFAELILEAVELVLRLCLGILFAILAYHYHAPVVDFVGRPMAAALGFYFGSKLI